MLVAIGLLLAGISLLLGTILASIRTGGGEVQQSLGLTVKTLRMPSTAKACVGLVTPVRWLTDTPSRRARLHQ